MKKVNHLAIIMDGNTRWARENGVRSAEGHKQGADNIRKLLPAILKNNIDYVTLYAFSSENWSRPSSEVNFIMNLFDKYLLEKIDEMPEDIKFIVIGDDTRFSQRTKNAIDRIQEITKNNTKLTLCIAFGYGGRLEIIDAAKKITKDILSTLTHDIQSKSLQVLKDIALKKLQMKIDDISLENFTNYLYDPKMPDVDILIRTGGMLRISNFLLWQSAYAELFFSSKYWPDFDSKDLQNILEEYDGRKRTFGLRV